MRRLGLVLERLTELSKGTVGALLRACRGGGCVKVWSLLLADVCHVASNRRLGLRSVGRGLYLGLRVEMGGEFVLAIQRGIRTIVQTLLRNVGGLRLMVVCEGWLRDCLGLRGE